MKITFALFLCMCSLHLLSCGDDNTTCPTSQNNVSRVPWQLVERMNGTGRYVMNCYADSTAIYAYGSGVLYQKDKSGNELISLNISSGGQNRWKTPMSSTILPVYGYTADYGMSVFSIRSNDNPSNNSRLISWSEFVNNDSLLSENSFNAFDGDITREVGAINQSTNQLLLPIKALKKSSYVFYLLSFNIDSDGSIRFSSGKVIEMKEITRGIVPPMIWSFFGRFYVFLRPFPTEHQGLYTIDSAGNYQKLSQQISGFYLTRMFQRGKTLYAVSESKIYISEDEGKTWTATYSTNFYAEKRLFTVVNDSVLMAYNDNIHQIQFTSNGFSAKQLDNTEFKGAVVTGFAHFQDTAYISTTIGLFKKPWKNLFDTLKTN